MIYSHLGITLMLAKYIMLTILAENMSCNCSGLLVHHLLSFYCQSLLIVSLVCYLKLLAIYLKSAWPFCLFFISVYVCDKSAPDKCKVAGCYSLSVVQHHRLGSA